MEVADCDWHSDSPPLMSSGASGTSGNAVIYLDGHDAQRHFV